VYDINAPHAFGLRESKPNAMHAYGRSSAPIAQGLVCDINAPHAFGLRESKPNAMHFYGRNSAPIAQGLVYDINEPHAFGLRESKRTCMPVSTPIAQGLVVIINSKDKKIVISPKAQGLLSNTHHGKKRMLENCTHDRMSGRRSNSGATAKKTTFSDETNHAAVSLTPMEDDSSRWVSTLAPLTLLKAASKHVIIIDKGPNKGLLFEDNTGSNLGHTVGFLYCPEFLPPQIHPTTRWLDYKSSHTMAQSHSGFFLFYHYNLQGSCLLTVIQPLAETAGLLISWVFSFLPRTVPTSTDQQGGVSFQTTPMGKITHTHSPRTGVESSKTYLRV